MAKKNFVVPIVALMSVLAMSGCSGTAKDGSTPFIGENGHWWIGETDTGVDAAGKKGDTGSTPTITIDANGFWCVDGVSTGVSAKGQDGTSPAAPVITINDDGFWCVDGVSTGVSAKGQDGSTPDAPVISINDDGIWCINNEPTGVSAKGQDGTSPAAPTVEIGIDDCWWINGVSTGVSAVGADGAAGPTGPQGPQGEPGQTGAEGKSAFDIFMEHYPHYTGTEGDWIKGVADGTLADNMPKAGHSGDWSFNSETNKIERTCGECGVVESKDATLPEFVNIPVTDAGIEGVIEIDNTTDWPWTFDSGVWTSGNKGVHDSDSVLKIKSLVGGTTLKYHVHASGEGSSANYDYFSGSASIGASSTLGGTHVGTPGGGDKDVVVTFTDANSDTGLSFRKDGSGSAGDDEAVVTNMIFSIPTDIADSTMIPAAVVVNFDAGNGDPDTQQLIWEGSGVTLPTPTKAGFAFDGWFMDAECTVPATATFDTDCTLHAKWVKTHTVTIANTAPGADDTSVTVKHGEVLDIETPTNDEKLFGGFFTSMSCAPGTEFDISTPIMRDTLIFCKWNDAPAYCGSYGGNNMWGANFGDTSGKSLRIAPNGTMTGQYTGTVTGINDDGSLIVTGTSDKLYVVDDMIIGISGYGADEDFYVFVKGKDPVSSDNKFILNTGLSSDGTTVNNKGRIFSVDRDGVVTNYCIFGTTLYKNVTVSSLDGDFEIGVSADTYGKDICVKDDQGQVITTQIKRKAVSDDYGIFTDEDSHVLKLYGDDSTGSLDGEMISYTKDGDNIKFIEGVVKTTFKTTYGSGWSSSNASMVWDDDNSVWNYKTSSTTATEFTDPDIVWEKTSDGFFSYKTENYGKVTVTLDKTEKTFSTSRPTFTVTKHIGDTSTNVVVRDGIVVDLGEPEVSATQQFEGWFDNNEFTGDAITQMTAAGDVYAKIVDVYKLIVHKNLTDEDTTETIVFHADETMTPPEVTLEGSDFVGWFTDEDCETPYVPAANVESVEIYAKWIKGKYTNSAANWFDAADPEEKFIDTITWDAGIYAWKKDTLVIDNVEHTGMKSGNYHSTTTCNISVKFKSEAIVSFDWFTAGESNYDYLEVYKNSTKVIDGKGKAQTTYGQPAIPYTDSATINVAAGDVLKFSFKQDSSFYEPDCGFIYNLSIAAPAPADLVLDPNYEGANPVITAGKVGFEVKPGEPAAREGFVFDGWFTDATCETPFVEGTTMTEDGLTLYAKWIAEKNVTLVLNNGDQDMVKVVGEGKKLGEITVTNKVEGKYLSGWFTTSTFDDGTDVDPSTLVVNSDVTLYAKWDDAVAQMGEYYGFNMFGAKSGSDGYLTSNKFTIAPDGTATGLRSGTIVQGEDGVFTIGSSYFYFNGDMGIIWTAYSAGKPDVSSDTYILFDTSRVKSVKYTSSATFGGTESAYTGLIQVTYKDNTVRYALAYNNVIYADVTWDQEKTFGQIESSTKLTVRDSEGNVIFNTAE